VRVEPVPPRLVPHRDPSHHAVPHRFRTGGRPMKYFRGLAAALVIAGTFTAPVSGQSMTGGTLPALAGFGTSLALGEDELFVGEPNNRARPGLVHVYRRTATGWEAAAELRAEGATPADGFGQTIVLDGSTLFVGVPSRDENRGIVYVFERRDGAWTQTAELTADDIAQGSRFGAAIAIRGDIALVAAPGHQDMSGVVHVYSRSDGTWTHAARIAADSPTPRSLFGNAVAL